MADKKRARDEDGKFVADDPSTPDVNEAYEQEAKPEVPQTYVITLDTLNNHFEKLITTRRNQLEKPMGKILGLQLGQTEENLEIKR